MSPAPQIDAQSDVPLYRQVFQQLKDSINDGRLARGSKLPATRELAGQLGLNRTTVSAAYELLESEGLITGHVGRGSFVADGISKRTQLNWSDVLEPAPQSQAAPASTPPASFSSSRPSELLFPLEEFRSSCAEVIQS